MFLFVFVCCAKPFCKLFIPQYCGKQYSSCCIDISLIVLLTYDFIKKKKIMLNKMTSINLNIYYAHAQTKNR